MKFLLAKLLLLVQMVWAVQAQNCKANASCKDKLGSCKLASKTCDGTVDKTAGVCQDDVKCQCCLPACPARCIVGTCPSGYTLVNNQCLTFNTGSLSASAAQLACQKAGGRLAKARGDGTTLATYIKANHAGKNFWLGASDVDTEGTWLWFSGGSVDSSIWYTGEPNNAGGNEDCMMWWGQTITGYIDEPCSESCNYICEAEKTY